MLLLNGRREREIERERERERKSQNESRIERKFSSIFFSWMKRV
jgi:hypothetical protein